VRSTRYPSDRTLHCYAEAGCSPSVSAALGTVLRCSPEAKRNSRRLGADETLVGHLADRLAQLQLSSLATFQDPKRCSKPKPTPGPEEDLIRVGWVLQGLLFRADILTKHHLLHHANLHDVLSRFFHYALATFEATGNERLLQQVER